MGKERRGRELTTIALTAKSLLFNIQNAHVANHLFPSLHAMGKILSIKNSLKIGPSSPSYTLAMAIANCGSFSWLKHTFIQSFNASANRKNAAAYSYLCFPSSANAFFFAAVLHRGSSKLFERNLCVLVCSLFQCAMRHSPRRTFFLLRAK